MIEKLAQYRGRPLRVLHGCYEIAGQGMVLAQGLRALGCEARSFSYRVDWDGRRSDRVVELDRYPGAALKGMAMLASFLRHGPRFDLFHFHFGTSFLPRQLDLPLLKAMGKRLVFHFHGCEVRNRAHMLKTHELAACTECDPFCIPPRQRWLLGRVQRHADHVFYSTLDLAESVPNSSHLPLAIEAARWEQAGLSHPPSDSRRDGVQAPVVVAHAPTNRLIKGTRHVEDAVERLRSEFPLLELRLIERRPWAEMPAQLAECDILVDQLFMGWYGLLAIEGMSEGKAVVAYMRPDFARPPGCPVVSATPATVIEALRSLIRDPARRAELGAHGRQYARREHDASTVASRLLPIYRACLRAPA